MGFFSNLRSAVSGSRENQRETPREAGVPVASASPDLSPESSTEVFKRILMVDANDEVGREFGRLIQQRRRSWEVNPSREPADALDQLTRQPFDAVVASAQLPGRTGVELLNDVGRRFPGLARVVRHSPEDKPLLRGFIGWPPSQLSCEMDVNEIEAGLERAFQMGEWMKDPAIRTLLPKMLRLPSVPDLYARVVGLLASPQASVDEVGSLVAREPAFTAKLLQIVNSPTFALARPITSAVEAVMFLGAERTKALILVANTSLNFDFSECTGFSHEKFWRHSLATGGLARAIALSETHDAGLADEAFTAGLLHDVGKLLFAANVTEQYSQTLSVGRHQKLPDSEAERLGLGVSHATIGACLLGTWGLPLRLLRAVAWHHAPSDSGDGQFSLLTAVHAANALECSNSDGPAGGPLLKLDRAYLTRLGLDTHWLRWRELATATPEAA